MNSVIDFFFSSRRRHTRCALVTGVQTCALPISAAWPSWMRRNLFRGGRQSILTIAILAMTAVFAGKGLSWLLFDATFAGGAAACRLASGACGPFLREIGRPSCRASVCQYVFISVVSVSLQKKFIIITLIH